MILNGSENYPIYLNPSDKELMEFAQSNWGTLLVMEWDGGILIASGYGNTHQTLVEFYKKHFKTKRLPDWDPIIFFHENHTSAQMLANLEDISGSRRAKPSEWRKILNPSSERMLTDLAQYRRLLTD